MKIARELGIHLHFLDNLNDLLGMYTYRHKERHILLNSNMEYLIMQMVCGHEIGHDTLHRDLAKGNESKKQMKSSRASGTQRPARPFILPIQ